MLTSRSISRSSLALKPRLAVCGGDHIAWLERLMRSVDIATQSRPSLPSQDFHSAYPKSLWYLIFRSALTLYFL